MSVWDHVAFWGYLLGVLVLGLRQRRQSHGFAAYFLAGRSMHWLPVGLSIVATAFSAVNYAGFSAEVSQYGCYVLLCLPVFAVVAWPVTRLVMPLYRAMGVHSIYEYLEHRFDVRVRTAASALFIFWRLLWMALLIHVPSKALSLMGGLDHRLLVLLSGAVATAYTLVGGMRAVMYTDVAQFVVVVGSILLAIAVAATRHPAGMLGLLHEGLDAGLARPFHPFAPEVFALDPTLRITLWSCWVGTFVAFLARYGADQMLTQRYLAARTLRDARTGFGLHVASSMGALLLLALLGFAIHGHAVRALDPQARQVPMLSFSSFVRSLPAGVPGLVLAGLLAATMSSADSGMNACAAAVVADFYRRLLGGAPDTPAEERVSRGAVLAFGAAATGMALFVGRLGTVFEVANRVINAMGGPLLALFLAGLLSRRANRRSALAGALLGALASTYICVAVEPLALHYYVVANLAVTLAVIWGASLLENRLCGPPAAAQLAWTWAGRGWERGGATRRSGAAPAAAPDCRRRGGPAC